MARNPAKTGLGTRAIHAGQHPDPSTGAIMTPIYATSTYVQKSPGVHQGYEYSRTQNPTRMAYERCVADLEGGRQGYAFASGLAAAGTVLELLDSGSHVIAMDDLYGGSYRLFERVRRRSAGLDFTFIDLNDAAALKAALKPNTRMIWAETPTNPMLKLVDLARVGAFAKKHGLIFVVDNTFCSPMLQRPIEHGADIVVHSATKFLGGHGTAIGGIVVDSGTFAWGEHADRYPGLTSPDPSYHGLNYWEALGPLSYIIKLRVQLLRDLGPAISPQNAFLLIQGIETLSLRVERHVQNAQAVAEWLEGRDEVEKVYYAGLPSSPWHALQQKYMPGGAGAVVAFDLRGGVEAGKKFVDALELHSHLANIGDVRSLVIHPASTTHSQLSGEEQLATGVTPGLVRLSVGLEGIEDIKADLEAGFRAAKAAG